MLLYSRKKVRYRRDGYCWKKRKDGKTTREDHMKLKVQGTEVSSISPNCFYAPSNPPPPFSLSYYLLETVWMIYIHWFGRLERIKTGRIEWEERKKNHANNLPYPIWLKRRKTRASGAKCECSDEDSDWESSNSISWSDATKTHIFIETTKHKQKRYTPKHQTHTKRNETANEKKIWQQNGKFSKDHRKCFDWIMIRASSSAWNWER